MEKREPSLVPEWLRSSGSFNHLLSSSRSDSSSPSHNIRNRNSRSKNDVDSVCSPFLDHSSSTNTWRGSSNGSTKYAYSSFNINRNQRDKDRSREKNSRLSYMDPWDHETSVPRGTFLTGRNHEQLRRSQSITTRKQGSQLAQGFTSGLKNGGSMNMYDSVGKFPGSSPVKSLRRNGFDKDFPLLRAEDRHGGPDVVRLSSPSRSPTVQSLSVGNSASLVGEGWTSALAEVPLVIEKSSAASYASANSSATPIGPATRNMAEALVKAPTRTVTLPQGSVNTQKFEERAIKQSRQLIPVVPSIPKGLVLNSSDKSKTKSVNRSCETGLASVRNTQQQSSVILGYPQPNPGSQIKPDTNKKLVVLKPARENGMGAGGSPPNSRTARSQLTAAPSTTVSVGSTNSPRKLKGAASLNMLAGNTIEKKLSLAHTQSRSAFYRALKQKTSTNVSTDPSKTSSCIFFSVEEKEISLKERVASDHSRDESMERVEKAPAVERNNGFESADRPDEKEAEFLKSLGWDENNTEEDEGLTEEEIRAFIEQYKSSKPSLVQKLPIIQEATEDITSET